MVAIFLMSTGSSRSSIHLDPDTLALEPGALQVEVERCRCLQEKVCGNGERRVRVMYAAHVFGAHVTTICFFVRGLRS